MSRRAFTNCTVYLGGGRLIPRGFVLFDREGIRQVGPESDFTSSQGAEVADLAGGLVLPGLVDAHIHLVAYAVSLVEIDLAPTASLESALDAVRSWVAKVPRGTWVSGRGWDKQRWAMEDFPTRWDLDRAAADHPVMLWSRDGHLAWLNSAALAALGLAEGVPMVEGGEVPVDGSGAPTGIFKEKAANLVLSRLGSRDAGPLVGAVEAGCKKLRELGLTAVHTIEDESYSDLLDKAVAGGRVPIGLVRMREVLEPEDVDRLKPSAVVQYIKTYADGTLGSQTAHMVEPFSGQPDNFGIRYAPVEKLRAIAGRAVAAGFGMSVHAIGDRANREILDIYAELRQTREGREARLRVEHAQVLRSEDIPRFAALRVLASMQPIHLVADRYVAEKYWGARSANTYAWKRILVQGGEVAFGSDAPIESPDPLRGIHAAVTRTDPARPGDGPWYPEERIPVWQAVDCYTGGGGGVRAGRPANLTVLDTDILGVSDPDRILKARVAATVVGGVPESYA